MNIITIFALFIVFLCGGVYIAKRAKNKKIQSFVDQNDLGKYSLVIDSTQELLNYSTSFPYSRGMLILLYKRKLNAIEIVRRIDPVQRKKLKALHTSTQKELEQIRNSFQTVDLHLFKLPKHDDASLKLLRIIKRLKKVTKMEYSERNISNKIYTQEFGRLDILEMQINIENIITKAQHATFNQELSTAKTLLERGIASLKDKKGASFVQMREKLEGMLKQIQESA